MPVTASEVLRSTGHGFCGLSRKRLLNILQERCRELGVTLEFHREVTDVEAIAAEADLVLAADGANSFVRIRFAEHFKPEIDWRRPAGAGGQSTVGAGLQIGLGTKSAATEVIMTQGSLNQTSNPLDVAIEGSGFFEVQRPDGTIAYTRAGQFHLNNQGTIVTTDGDPLIWIGLGGVWAGLFFWYLSHAPLRPAGYLTSGANVIGIVIEGTADAR